MVVPPLNSNLLPNKFKLGDDLMSFPSPTSTSQSKEESYFDTLVAALGDAPIPSKRIESLKSSPIHSNLTTNLLPHSLSSPDFSSYFPQPMVQTYSQFPEQKPPFSNYLSTNGINNSPPKLPTNGINCLQKRNDSNLIDLITNDNQGEQFSLLLRSDATPEEILAWFDPLFEKVPENNPSQSKDGIDINQTVPKHIPPSEGTEVQLYDDDESDNDEVIYTEVTFGLNKTGASFSEEPSKTDTHLTSVKIQNKGLIRDPSIEAFFDELRILRSDFTHDDIHTNIGVVISPTLESQLEEQLSIKLVIHSKLLSRPVIFTCDINTGIEHIISQVILSQDDVQDIIDLEAYLLKVLYLVEYLTLDSVLSDYEYIHQCLKYDHEVELVLVHVDELQRPLARTSLDDHIIIAEKIYDVLVSRPSKHVPHETATILLDTLKKESDKLLNEAQKSQLKVLFPQGVVQAVKAICTVFSHVETTDITNAVQTFCQFCLLFSKGSADDINYLANISSSNGSDSKNFGSVLGKVVELLTNYISRLYVAVEQLLCAYCRYFTVDFTIPVSVPTECKDVTSSLDTLIFYVEGIFQIPPNWKASYDHYVVRCSLIYGTTIIGSVETKPAVIRQSFFERIMFIEWLQFDVPMCTLQRESRISAELIGVKIGQDNKQNEAGQQMRSVLGWCTINLFNFKQEFAQGSHILGFWPDTVAQNNGYGVCNEDPRCTVIQISLPMFNNRIIFPEVIERMNDAFINRKDIAELGSWEREKLLKIINKNTSIYLTSEEKEVLWSRRHYLTEFSEALPKVLISAHGWDWACLSDIYTILQEWCPMQPVDALVLLQPCFPDREVRRFAIQYIKNIGSDELCDYLPQMVQALQFEIWDSSPIAWFLLERSLTSVRVAHNLYWLLKQNLEVPLAGKRMRLMYKALLAVCGKALQAMFRNEEELLHILDEIANKIKEAKDSVRLNILLSELETVHHWLEENPVYLPLSPSLRICGVEVRNCMYYTSNTLPLKIIFHNTEAKSKPIEVLYKVGDDLRQDMLTLQIIRIMDKLWLKEGLDLKIITFSCIPTGRRKGVVEIVKDSATLRKIQSEMGLAGSFKDRPIAEWLRKNNTSELEYLQAVENFTYSCAGYSVVTYILGICDRHNDNIMIKTTGHLFHIDFGKFLGDAQMFGKIKRDRTPFILTSDMVYVINGGDKPSKKFQNFIDLCCQAFNIIRRHSTLFLNLFTLMSSSSIPGVTKEATSYIQKMLLPELTEGEATARFARFIEESLNSWFTQFNFFIHSLAQLRFTGDHNDEQLLSFVPKMFSRETDGKLIQAVIVEFKKRYDPEKCYFYTVEVKRERMKDSQRIYRTYREFYEFYQKLLVHYPLAKYHPLPRISIVGRSNTGEVAEKRKYELDIFLKSLKLLSEEIAHSKLVYTFFHPILRDQEGASEYGTASVNSSRIRRSSSLGNIKGQVKLSIGHKINCLCIMVHHARNLNTHNGSAPDSYVKTYLLPDSAKQSKRKTKIVWKNCHPTFMQMLTYRLPLEMAKQKVLQVSIWDYDRVQENEFLGATIIHLNHLDLTKETAQWYPLSSLPH